ncbi:LPS export ABC transporter periplasmic protein LptC [Marinospirillum minutulum]|uniref:LPS export ABC transporter periplasmic protein LptC n=1 Tax=Marinospirillum minutulum TaxID=64974 RepID=UPI0004027570|nr:LPS export ABC transporter periplasmic protein LptC [Marinospirillum minutulum]
MSRFPSLRKLGALLALIALGILVVGIQDLSLPPPHASLPEQYGEPDYYVEAARLTRFNAEGKRLQTLNSVQATHYPEKDLTLFESPLMHHYSEQGQVWRVVAKRAENLAKKDIYLEEEVIITPLNPDSTYLPEFFTDRLWVDTQTNIAHTKDPVSFISPSGKTTGKGLQLNMDTGLAEILQEVQGSYLPSPAIQGTEP